MTDLLVRGEQFDDGERVFRQSGDIQKTAWDAVLQFEEKFTGFTSETETQPSPRQITMDIIGAFALQDISQPKLAELPPESKKPGKRYPEPKVIKEDSFIRSTYSVTYPEGELPLVVESGVTINPRLLP
jgi:hypothetical protein